MKGILLKDYLLPPVLDGTKTQTRRIIKLPRQAHPKCTYNDIELNASELPEVPHKNGCMYTIKPGYKKNETVYVKENHFRFNSENGGLFIKYPDVIGVHYKNPEGETFSNDGSCIPHSEETLLRDGYKKMSKLLLPAFSARHFIKIKRVWAERLQDISDGDCMAEGIEERDWLWNGLGREYRTNYRSPHDTETVCSTPREAFEHLIDGVNGKGAWESNPFVFCYEFEKTERPCTGTE